MYTPTNHTYTPSHHTYSPGNQAYSPGNHAYSPGNHTYTLPSSSTSNCYASLTQLPLSPSETLPRPVTLFGQQQTLPRTHHRQQTLTRPITSLARPATSTALTRDFPSPTLRALSSGGTVESSSGGTVASSSGGSHGDCCTLTTVPSAGSGSRDSSLNRREILVDPYMAHLQENFKHLQVKY